MKYCIIGTINEVYQEKIGESFLDHYEDVVIATFDEKYLAEQYIEESRLSKRVHHTYGSDDVFRKRSLLCNCESAEIEEYLPDDSPPHNPIL